jgi:hypothetical protein
LALCTEANQIRGAVVHRFCNFAEVAGHPDVMPHVLGYTSTTWALQRGADSYYVSDFFGCLRKDDKDEYMTTYGVDPTPCGVAARIGRKLQEMIWGATPAAERADASAHALPLPRRSEAVKV